VISLADSVTISGRSFVGYGAHHDDYPVPYAVCSCTLGITKQDIDLFLCRLHDTFEDLKEQDSKDCLLK
jgi:hypothetical protein